MNPSAQSGALTCPWCRSDVVWEEGRCPECGEGPRVVALVPEAAWTVGLVGLAAGLGPYVTLWIGCLAYASWPAIDTNLVLLVPLAAQAGLVGAWIAAHRRVARLGPTASSALALFCWFEAVFAIVVLLGAIARLESL